MKRTLTAIALALAATSVSAADLTIATGKTGGGYDAAALRAATKLGQRGHEVDVKNLNGSDEITLMLCRGEAQVGLTQIDAMDARAAEGCMLRPIATYGSGELAMIFFPPGSDYDELDDMGEGNAVLVDTIGSGTSLFWDTIVRIETGDYGNNSAWSKIKPVNDPISMAEPLAQFGDIDAVILVRTPDSQDVANLIARGWEMGELYDRHIDEYEFNGQPLYEAGRQKFSVDGKRVKGYGYKVRSFVVTTDTVARDRQLFSQLAGAF